MQEETGSELSAARGPADIVNKPLAVGAAITDGTKVSTSAAEEGLQQPISPRAARMRLLSNPSWQDFLGFILSLGAVTLIVILLVLLGWDTLRHSITIETISVPKSLAEDQGFSSSVASQRLQDAIDKPSPTSTSLGRPRNKQRRRQAQ